VGRVTVGWRTENFNLARPFFGGLAGLIHFDIPTHDRQAVSGQKPRNYEKPRKREGISCNKSWQC